MGEMGVVREHPEARVKSLVSVDAISYEAFRLSKTEELVCEVWAETGSYKACQEACMGTYRRKIKGKTIKHWLETRPLVRAYVTKKLEEKGRAKMSREEWEGGMYGIIRGDKKIQRTTPMMYKLIGEARGWFKEEGDGVGIRGQNVVVNILQQDGRG